MKRDTFTPNLAARNAKGARWRLAFLAATAFSVLFLASLIASIVNQSFGYVVMTAEVDPATLQNDGVPLEKQDEATLAGTIRGNVSRRLFVKLDAERSLASRSREELLEIIVAEIVQPTVRRTWTLAQSLFDADAIRGQVAEEYPDGNLSFRSWVNAGLFANPQSSVATAAGIRGAIIGSLATLLLTLLVAFPLGVGAAIYLQEYAKDNAINRIIETNIYNLAGVPSIIYGMLGLAIFVRALEPLTSGAIFRAAAAEGANGRTILSASLTLALLILPIVIINAQEALRAIPDSLRQSSLAVGATKWQTIRHHVLPAAADRILTGTVLAVSRALGETAPLVVVGASTFLTQDPAGPFSKFTTLPIQIYQWTARPQAEFRNLAAAAILVLLVLGLSLNAAAIIARNRFRREKRLGR
ncbi:MAG TPA: phosphate ABC transporter permease PtsA [Treponema sp.]|nr:MAG: phosphate ABC transporter, permease protein PstA [Treponema sp. GWC1_61_84]HCM26386.1 phosphate ABC transporter permease PtsA [Treponema sp.]